MEPAIFGLDGHPFETEYPRPDDTVLFEAQAALVAELRAGLKTPQGIIVLVGESGVGKSALMAGLVERLGDNTRCAYLPEAGPGLRGILAEALEQLSAANGQSAGKGNDTHLSGALRDAAKANAAKGKNTLVVIDGAHELPAKTIERFARVFPKDPAEPSKLHLVLVGRNDLLDRLNAAGDRSVLRYLVQVCRMDGIGPEDSFRYIAERINRAGGTVEKVFSQEVLGTIVREAAGLPLQINILCRAALENAARAGSRKVSADALGPSGDAGSGDNPGAPEAADSSQARPPAAANRTRMGVWAAGLLALVIGFAAALSTGDKDDQQGATDGNAALPLAVVVGEENGTNPPANPPKIAKLALVRAPTGPVKPAAVKKPVPPPKPIAKAPKPAAKPAAPKVPARSVTAPPAKKPGGRVVASGKLPVKALPSVIDDVKKKAPPAFSVQVGAFRTPANAEEVVARLAKRGFKGAQVVKGAGSVYRVMSGGFPTAQTARGHAKALAAKGFSTYVKKMTR